MIEAPAQPTRIGIVNYLNTLPLIDGLEQLADISLLPDVPSRLIERLLADEVELALCSVFDYQQSPEPLTIIPAGLLGCDGSTMTVRLFSKVPIQRITRIFCDTDSHTSVNLLRVLLQSQYQIKPELISFDARAHCAVQSGVRINWPEALLLIGDKVVTDSTPAIRYPYQLDLGAEWKELTGLPFIFAAWMMKRGVPDESKRIQRIRAVASVLDRQRRHNLERIDSMLHRHCAQSGWPRDLAWSYLTEMIQYQWTDSAQAGLEHFFKLCYELGLTKENRPLKLLDSALTVPADDGCPQVIEA